jgi:hypothetical protein
MNVFHVIIHSIFILQISLVLKIAQAKHSSLLKIPNLALIVLNFAKYAQETSLLIVFLALMDLSFIKINAFKIAPLKLLNLYKT